MAHATADSNARESLCTEPKTSGPSMTGLRESREHQIEEAIGVETEADTTEDDATTEKKSLGFYLSFFAINVLVFIYSLDATSLAVAIPVSIDSPPFPAQV